MLSLVTKRHEHRGERAHAGCSRRTRTQAARRALRALVVRIARCFRARARHRLTIAIGPARATRLTIPIRRCKGRDAEMTGDAENAADPSIRPRRSSAYMRVLDTPCRASTT